MLPVIFLFSFSDLVFNLKNNEAFGKKRIIVRTIFPGMSTTLIWAAHAMAKPGNKAYDTQGLFHGKNDGGGHRFNYHGANARP